MGCQHVFSGIRLAIGALEREVLTQFLVEAVVLSSFGGLIGIVLVLAGVFISRQIGFSSYPQLAVFIF
jgi:putative ABC transport system permease protein